MMKEKILVADDEQEIADLIEVYLENEGFQVRKFYDSKEALACIETEVPDLAVLDIMMPDISGLTLCRKIREKHNYPIIMLTAKNGELDKINGLALGADDYIAKPFGMMEFTARVRAVLRRSGKKENETDLIYKTLVIKTEKHMVLTNGEPVTLTLKEFELLKYLIENQDIVLTRNQILGHVWGYDFDGETRTVDVHVRTLRQKLGECGELIETVRGVGYRIGG